MKIGQQSTSAKDYFCSLVVLETACEECPLEHLGMLLFDERVAPIDQEFTEWDACRGSSSSSEAVWWVDIFPRPLAGNKVCVINRSDQAGELHECIPYSEYDPSMHEMIYGPYLEDECAAQCPPADSYVFKPRCIPLSTYDSEIHDIVGGPYFSEEICGTGFESSSSSSASGPTCTPTIELITLPDGSLSVVVKCYENDNSSTSSNDPNPNPDPSSSSTPPCVLEAPPETQTEFCPDGRLNYTVYFLPDFKQCVWIPTIQPGNECQASSSSCEYNKRYCLYTNFSSNSLSILFSQEDKPPPCTYRYYCLPDGCQYLCEDDGYGTPVDSCPFNCCGEGICDVNCEGYSLPNCLVCAIMGGEWFMGGVGWREWHVANCGCIDDSDCAPGDCCVEKTCVPCDTETDTETDTDTDTDTGSECTGECAWSPVWQYYCQNNGDCPEGLCCNSGYCSPCLTGACCIEGQCSVGTESNCLSQGGTWQGANTTCEDGSCQNRCCVQRENENGCLVTVCEDGHFYCSSNCYDPDAPNPSMTGLPDCQNGTELHNTVTVGGVVFNTGDAAFDSLLSGAMNTSYSITRGDCFGNDPSSGGTTVNFPLGGGNFAIVGFPGTTMRTASIGIYNFNINPPLLASIGRNEGFRSSVTTSCGNSVYDCSEGVSGSPGNSGGLGDYTNATIYTS